MYICFVPFKFGEKIEDTATIYKKKRVGSRDEYLFESHKKSAISDGFFGHLVLAVTSVETLQQQF